MVRNAKFAIAPARAAKLPDVLQEPCLLAARQDNGTKPARAVTHRWVPTAVIQVQTRAVSSALAVTRHDVVHEITQDGLAAPNSPERETFGPTSYPVLRFLTATEQDAVGLATAPKPMLAGSRNH